MSEMRLEAIDLIDKFPEESLSKVVELLKNFLKDEDPFYSEENMAELKRRADDFDNKRNIFEHELIEVD